MLDKSMVIWWRYGNEHQMPDAEWDGLRVNSPEVIASAFDRRLEMHRKAPPEAWQWWQAGSDLIIERPEPDAFLFGPQTRIYYLPQRGLGVVDQARLRPPHTVWSWYIHLADIFYDQGRQTWVMKDLFCDILVSADNRQQRLLDLDDLAQALEIGLVSPAQASAILRRTDAVMRDIAEARFPYPEIERARLACQELGWG